MSFSIYSGAGGPQARSVCRAKPHPCDTGPIRKLEQQSSNQARIGRGLAFFRVLSSVLQPAVLCAEDDGRVFAIVRRWPHCAEIESSPANCCDCAISSVGSRHFRSRHVAIRNKVKYLQGRSRQSQPRQTATQPLKRAYEVDSRSHTEYSSPPWQRTQ